MGFIKDFLPGIPAAFSLFSAIPLPDQEWKRENLRYMLCAFPLVGLAVGGLCGAWAAAAGLLGLSARLRSAGLCLIPVLVTGGIHLDGFCDTWDALASHAAPERRREILRDSHIGTFAVIHLILYFLLSYVLWAELPSFRTIPVVLGFALSRSLSGYAVAAFPVAQGSYLASSFAEAAERKRVRRICGGTALLCACLMCLFGGWGMAAAAAGVFLWYHFRLLPAFAGLSGDLAGWFLQEAELWMLIGLFVTQLLEGWLG